MKKIIILFLSLISLFTIIGCDNDVARGYIEPENIEYNEEVPYVEYFQAKVLGVNDNNILVEELDSANQYYVNIEDIVIDFIITENMIVGIGYMGEIAEVYP